jgi:sulfatase maturation enzyme AslB (radical SAM superfamily)
MYCPRLDHFIRLNANGTFGICGHMVNPPGFSTYVDAQQWANKLKIEEWPDVCVRCKETEQINGESIRTNAIKRHAILSVTDPGYLIIGGTLDNYCNSACLTCSDLLSTKISKLKNTKILTNNYGLFNTLPLDRIYELDINGGEPTVSKNYSHLLDNLPANVKIVRINTNGGRYFQKVEQLLKRRIKVIITLSLDGTGTTHDFVRWPVKWDNFTKTVNQYLKLQKKYTSLSLDFWTTLSCLNLLDLNNIINYANECGIPHQYGILKQPDVLDIKYTNWLTLKAKSYIDEKLSTMVAIDINNNNELEKFILESTQLRKIPWQK